MGKVPEEELLKECADGAGSDADEDVVDGYLGVVLLAIWVVEA